MKIFIGEMMSCNLNYQPEYIVYQLEDNFEITTMVEDADIIVFPGTCSCTNENISYSIEYISSILKRKKTSAKTYVTGCLTRKFKKSELFDIENWLEANVDFIIPQNSPNLLLKMISEEKFKNIEKDDFGAWIAYQNEAYLYISNGCLNNCTFCKTTFQKLPLKSVDFNKVKLAVNEIAMNGIKKINLVGTNISQYGLDINGTYMLPKLIEYIENVYDISELGLIGFAFKDAINNDFSFVMQNSSKLNLISGSLESGSDRILNLMRKGFTSEEIIQFIETIRKKYPKDFLLSIIAGFPTEEIEDVKKTLDVLNTINPSYVAICRYTDSKYVYSHQHPQLTPTEIQEHARIYQKVLSRRKISAPIKGDDYIYN